MNDNIKKFIGLGIGGIIFLIVLLFKSITILQPGEVGVLFRPFSGGLDNKIYKQGVHIIAPWNTMYVYDVRIQQGFERLDVLSNNGLNIHLDVSYRYKPQTDKMPRLHEEIGLSYREKVVIPEVRTAVREVIGKYTPEELYSTKREGIQHEIFEHLSKRLAAKYVDLDAMLIRSVKLPETIAQAIENKLKRQQEAMEYEFRIQREKKEAERKRIEAQGIKDFQRIVSEGLTPKFLTWKGIEATLDLAKSQNTKIVVIGNSKNGLPLILGGEK